MAIPSELLDSDPFPASAPPPLQNCSLTGATTMGVLMRRSFHRGKILPEVRALDTRLD